MQKLEMSSHAILRCVRDHPLALAAPLVIAATAWVVNNWDKEEALEDMSKSNDRRTFGKSDHGLVLFDLPNIDREPSKVDINELASIMNVLHKYEVSPLRGFLPHKDPLQRLSGKYEKWEDLENDEHENEYNEEW